MDNKLKYWEHVADPRKKIETEFYIYTDEHTGEFTIALLPSTGLFMFSINDNGILLDKAIVEELLTILAHIGQIGSLQ